MHVIFAAAIFLFIAAVLIELVERWEQKRDRKALRARSAQLLAESWREQERHQQAQINQHARELMRQLRDHEQKRTT